jgi:hypothetical protein
MNMFGVKSVARTAAGTAVLAVLVSIVGVASASASTTLCKTNATSPVCATADQYPSGTVIKGALATGTKAVFTGNLGTLTCTTGLFEGKTKAQSSAGSLPAEISRFALGGCSETWGGPCSSWTSTGFPIGLNVAWTEGNNGSVALSSPWRMGISCSTTGTPVGAGATYEFAAGSSFTLVGGNPASLQMKGVQLNRVGGTGDNTLSLSATWTISSPNPLYVNHL